MGKYLLILIIIITNTSCSFQKKDKFICVNNYKKAIDIKIEQSGNTIFSAYKIRRSNFTYTVNLFLNEEFSLLSKFPDENTWHIIKKTKLQTDKFYCLVITSNQDFKIVEIVDNANDGAKVSFLDIGDNEVALMQISKDKDSSPLLKIENPQKEVFTPFEAISAGNYSLFLRLKKHLTTGEYYFSWDENKNDYIKYNLEDHHYYVANYYIEDGIEKINILDITDTVNTEEWQRKARLKELLMQN